MLLLQHFTKQCSKCHTVKKFNEFNNHINGKFKLRPDCKICVGIYKKKHRKDNFESISLKQSIWGKENRDYRRKYEENWKHNNKDKVTEYSKRYSASNKGRICSKNAENRRRDFEKKGKVTNSQLSYLQQNAKKCYWCGIDLKNVKIHIDHYEPLSKGGSHDISNLVVSCHKCNRTKSAKDPIAFANSIGKLL